MSDWNWTLFAIGLVIGFVVGLVILYALCRSAGEADDRADETLERMRGGDGDGMLWS